MSYSLREKRLLIFSVIAIALPLSFVLYTNRINATPKVEIPPYPTAPNPNGYDLYVAAVNAINPAGSEVYRVLGQLPSESKARAQQFALKHKTAWLNTNKKAFALFDQAMKTPTLAPSARALEIDTAKISYQSFDRMAHYKTIESDARWLRKDYYGALSSGLDIIQMGHDVRRGGNLRWHSSAVMLGFMGRSTTDVVTMEHLNAAQAQSAAQRIEAMLAKRWNLDQALTEEKYASLASLLQGFQLPYWRDPQFMRPSLPTPTLAGRLRRYTISKQQVVDDVSAECDRQIANARLPYSQKGAPPTHYNNPFVTVESLNSDTRLIDTRDLASDRLLLLRLALRAYRLEHGAYPLDLKDLTPQYLKAIPADPYGNGEAMRYKSDGKTHALWSIGPDGKDDGAKPIPIQAPSFPLLPGDRKLLPPVGDGGGGTVDNLYYNGTGDIVAGKNN